MGKDSLEVTILGCGPSSGVPLVGYKEPYWGACDPQNPLNRRTRSSIYVRYSGKGILVDAGPDLRSHLLDYGLIDLESVIITHGHADHIHGIDDLRPLYFARGQKTIPLMADKPTLHQLAHHFGYLFHGQQGGVEARPPILQAQEIPRRWIWQGFECQSFPQVHGKILSQGLRFGPLAYSTDFTDLDDQALDCLKDLDVWIVDCLGRTPKPTHCHLEKSLMWIEKVKPRFALLTHMNHELDYGTLLKELPPHIRPAHDGLKLLLEGGRLVCLPFEGH